MAITGLIAKQLLLEEERSKAAVQTAYENDNARMSSAAMVQASATGVKLAADSVNDLIVPAGKARVRKKYNSGISV